MNCLFFASAYIRFWVQIKLISGAYNSTIQYLKLSMSLGLLVSDSSGKHFSFNHKQLGRRDVGGLITCRFRYFVALTSVQGTRYLYLPLAVPVAER